MKRKDSEKKVLLFIVEGPSDETALGMPLVNLQKAHSPDGMIRFGVTYGDITSNFKVKNVTHEVVKRVKKYCDDYKLNKNDICEVVLLLDMDGAYIPYESISQSDKHSKAFYGDSTILHKNPKVLQETHEHKKIHVNKLIELKKIWGVIPFNVYFVSCNLDHIICKNANLTDSEKSDNAEDFSIKYGEDADGFLSFFYDSDILLSAKYKESWDFIKRDFNSLGRYSNMNVFLDRCYPRRKN